MLLLLALSRVGVYIPIDGVDRAAFAESMSQGNVSSSESPLTSNGNTGTQTRHRPGSAFVEPVVCMRV